MTAVLSRPRTAMLVLLALATIMSAILPGIAAAESDEEEEVPHVWVYSESLNYRHASIDHAKEVLQDLADTSESFTVEFSEDHTDLTRELLENTDVALFLSPSGTKDPGEVVYVNYERAPFTAEQRSMFVDWVSCGGGFVAVHQAADSYDDWPEWDELVGAKFLHHPIWFSNPEATIGVVGGDHPAVAPWAGIDEFDRPDEYYAWKPDQGPEELVTDFNPLLTMRGYTDPSVALTWGLTFEEEQPLAWTSSFRGLNRSFYTNLGHAAETWDEPDFQDHLVNGTLWVAEHELTEGCF